MIQENMRKFIGRAIVIDPKTGEDSAASAYVCVLLTGPELRPCITLGEAPDIDGLLSKLLSDDLHSRSKVTKVSFDPPPDDYPVNQSSARQRYEVLSFHEFERVQTVLSRR